MGNRPTVEIRIAGFVTELKLDAGLFSVYTDDKVVNEVFKKITGLSPLNYRAKYNKEAVPS